jgi:hypothetical protein
MDLRSASLCRLVRPYTVREMPGWGRLIDALGINGIDNTNPRWRRVPTVLARGKAHGYLMELDLSDDLERATYFVGRNYDLDIQLLLDVLLKPGNTFLDIGANVGMTTLHGASRVTSEGRVIAFEPQAACCRKIKRHLELNSIQLDSSCSATQRRSGRQGWGGHARHSRRRHYHGSCSDRSGTCCQEHPRADPPRR